jgi:hypothetical protein
MLNTKLKQIAPYYDKYFTTEWFIKNLRISPLSFINLATGRQQMLFENARSLSNPNKIKE